MPPLRRWIIDRTSARLTWLQRVSGDDERLPDTTETMLDVPLLRSMSRRQSNHRGSLENKLLQDAPWAFACFKLEKRDVV
jgi:hypothetical protein